MNLYKLVFEHYSQKDSKYGTEKYFIAKDVNEVFDYISKIADWEYYIGLYEDECYDSYDSFKEYIMANEGQIDDENMLDDLYYGKVLYGWELQSEDITEDEIKTLVKLGILKNEI